MGREEIKAGLLTLTALGVLSVFMILISGWNPWKEQTVYKTRFRMVVGVNPGSAVRMHGVPIGNVIDLRLVEDGSQVEVSFGLTGDRLLNAGVIAELAQASLLGESFLLLTQYRQQGEPLEPGALIPSRQKMDMAETMNAMGRLAGRAEAIMRDVQLVINDKEMGDLRNNIRQWQLDIGGVLAEAKGSVSGIDKVVANANSLLLNTDSAITGLKQTLDTTMDSIKHELKIATGLMSRLGLKLDKAVDTDQPLIAAMLRDGAVVMTDLKATTTKINGFVDNLNQAMGDVKVIAQDGRKAMSGVNTLVVKGQNAAESATRFMDKGTEVAAGVGRIVDQGDEVMAGVKGIVGQGRQAMTGVNKMVDQGEQTMTETRAGVKMIIGQGEQTLVETRTGVKRIVGHGEGVLVDTRTGVNRIVGHGERIMVDARAGVGRVVGQAEDAMTGVERIVGQGEDTMAGVGKIVDQGQGVMTGVNEMVGQGKGALAQADKAIRTGGQVLTKVDRAADIALEDLVAITASLVQASRNLESLVLKLRNNPGLVLSPVRASN